MNKLDGKRVLITGGTGSLGTALTERLLSGVSGNPDSISIFSRDELKQAEMRQRFNNPKLRFIIGDVRDYMSVTKALRNIDVVFNAAAMKRVETCEKCPVEAVKTNIIGAINIVESIQSNSFPIDTVIAVSSDKGCSPINTYGATKFLQERILLSGNYNTPTRFIAVCYGNVLASRGSVLQIWRQQIKEGGPITITDPLMTRFLIPLDQAVDTLIKALICANPGEIYIPIIPAATILDLAKVLINGEDIRFKVIGRGKGEKQHETLITREEAPNTERRGDYYVVTPGVVANPGIESEYCSKDYLLDKAGLRALLSKYQLLEN